MMESKFRRRHRLNNKGYSLVELIIVIGIIVVMTGVATVTVTLINSAKAKEAAVTFSSELADLRTKSKGQIVTVTTGTTTSTEPKYKFALKLYKDGSKCYIQKGYCDDTDKFFSLPDSNPNNGKGVSLSSRITIKYTETSTSAQKEIGDSDFSVVIAYDKNGRCALGSGVYDFYKNNGNLVDSVTIMKNGSYQN